MTASRSRIVAIAALIIAAALVAVLLIGGGGSAYTVHAKFPESGQLVKGALVQVGGRKVGKISDIRLTNDGAADIVLGLTDDEVKPLHKGTRAAIRAVGLASVGNRFVELYPGPDDAPEIPDDGVLDLTSTKGIVDLDQVLDRLDAPTRARLQRIIAETAEGLRPPTDKHFNTVLKYLPPALSQVTELGDELLLDEAALEKLVQAAGHTASTIAARPEALRGALANTSQTLAQIADHRETLGDSLDRAAAVFGQTTRTLANLQRALPAVDPVLAGLRPAAPQLAKLLRDIVPVTKDAIPTFAAVQELLPRARKALSPLPALADQAVPALQTGDKAIQGLTPILGGLRAYAPELIHGFFAGFGGSTSGYYDANGHFARISFNFGASGLPGLIPAPPSGEIGGLRTGLTKRCPGGATLPADDKSNPVVLSNDLCDEGQTLR